MKKIIYLLFVFVVLAACQDEKAEFDIENPSEIRFTPIAGGAIMHYKLPADDNVFRLKVRYVDAQGNEVIRWGSYACDSLEINGFNEARENVPAAVTICNRQDVESEPVNVTFSTLDSGPVAFFTKAEVKPYWNGFSLTYEGVSAAKGMAHVLYAGQNPLSGEPDTLLIGSFPIGERNDTIYYSLQSTESVHDIVIRTEDYRGFRVKQKVWEKVDSYQVKKMDLTEDDFYDPKNLVVNEFEMGAKYLFDGDLNGVRACQISSKDDTRLSTFLAGPYAKGEPFILDLGENGQVPAYLRIYAMLFVRYFPSGKYSPSGHYWGGDYQHKVPSAVSVYGSNTKEDDNSWVKLGSYEEPNNVAYASRWCYRAAYGSSSLFINKVEDVIAADPCYITVPMPPSEQTWRYLKFVVDELFGQEDGGTPNANEFVTFNELEVYVKVN